tara:strand:+ start:1049 stop:1948 length:900 start_codon:yes stop_codon:yes gene_type:complete
MKIAFFTEMGFNGKIPRTHKNMRTEFAWMVALNATHYNLKSIPSENYDLGIVVNSKNNPEWVNVEGLKSKCEKVAIMQEGPFWYFQDYPLAKQIHYFNNLTSADIIYSHNEVDVQYFKGLTNHKDVRVLRSLMVEDPINEITHPKSRSGIMVGGNMKSWYGGFDSFMLASSVTDEIYQPKMGRREEGEDELGLTQLPYMEWDQWISELSKRKIGVHMMRTHAAGTFALNCSYLGIPCIGYDGLDTQRILHPDLTVKDGDLNTARKLILKLDNDKDFYTLCSETTLKMYNEHYHESKFKI